MVSKNYFFFIAKSWLELKISYSSPASCSPVDEDRQTSRLRAKSKYEPQNFTTISKFYPLMNFNKDTPEGI